jgi:hypothetical protein
MPESQLVMMSFPHFITVTTCVLALTGMAVASSSCRADEPLPGGHYTFQAVTVVPINRTTKNGKTVDAKSDKLTHWIRFDVLPKYAVAKGSGAKPFKILNPSITTKSSLTLNKPITFKGKQVPAGTNLLKFRKFDGSRFNIHMPDLFPLAVHSVTITRDFEIPAGSYDVTFKWTTASGQVFSDKVRVFIDVELPKP